MRVSATIFQAQRQYKRKGAYVCVSPLGEKNHAAKLARTTTMRPMMMLQLEWAFEVRQRSHREGIGDRKVGEISVPIRHFGSISELGGAA